MSLKTGSKLQESLPELSSLVEWVGRMAPRMSELSNVLSRKEELELRSALLVARRLVERSLSRTQRGT